VIGCAERKTFREDQCGGIGDWRSSGAGISRSPGKLRERWILIAPERRAGRADFAAFFPARRYFQRELGLAPEALWA